MKKAEFIQSVPNAEAEKICMDNYKELGNKGTISTTLCPFVTIGKHGIYSIGVRFAKFGNQSPKWGYAALCGGGCQDGGFDSMQAAINAAVAYCEAEDLKFEKEYATQIANAKK